MTCLLCVVAHPDDETIFVGGTLALYAQRGVEVYLACATRGEGGEMGEPPLTTRENLGQVREKELLCAANALGVRQVIFLGYVDTLMLDEHVQPIHAELIEFEWKIVSLIRELKPEVVLTHGSNGEYGHPQHRQVNLATTRAFFGTRDPFRFPEAGQHFAARKLYYFSARPKNIEYKGTWWEHRVNRSDDAHVVIDVTPVLDLKEAAANCHRTQNALFMRRQNAPASLRGRLNQPEVMHRVFPVGDYDEQDLFE